MRALLVVAAALLVVTAGCGGTGAHIRVGDGAAASRAPAEIAAYGCGSCHTISGIAGADAHVGPSLAGFAERRYIAGRLPNTPQNLVEWIMHPQRVDPGNLMPYLGVSDSDARDIAAYLYAH
jgi:cytochrome c